MIEIRISEKAFHPNAKQEIIGFSKPIFAIKRTSVNGEEKILAIFNVSNQNQMIYLKNEIFEKNKLVKLQNLITSTTIVLDGSVELNVAPYEVIWLKSI